MCPIARIIFHAHTDSMKYVEFKEFTMFKVVIKNI